MPIKRNINETVLVREPSAKTIYVDSIGEAPKKGGKKKGLFYFIPMVGEDIEKVPSYWKTDAKVIRFSDYKSESPVNTARDTFTWSAGFQESDKVRFVNTKWIDSGLDTQLGDLMSDPGRSLGLHLPTEQKKKGKIFGGSDGNFPPSNTMQNYVTIPVLWGVVKNEMDFWTIYETNPKTKEKTQVAELVMLELRSSHWELIKALITKASVKSSTWLGGEEDSDTLTFRGSSGFNTVVELDKDGERGFKTYLWNSPANGTPNQHEIMQFLEPAYELAVKTKENILKYQAPWTTWADKNANGELSDEDATRYIVASIANLVLEHFGYDFEMPAHMNEILVTFEKELPKLSYAAGADIANAILATADGNTVSDDDDEQF